MNRQRLEKNLVDKAIASWSIRYREAGYTPDQLELISREYYEDLITENFGNQSFIKAAKYARRHCRYFPKIIDLLEARKVIGNMESRERLALPLPDLSEKQIEENLEKVRELIAQLPAE